MHDIADNLFLIGEVNMENNEDFMRLALKEARKAYGKREVSIGAVGSKLNILSGYKFNCTVNVY